MDRINYEAKTDRELLLLTAQHVNDIASYCPKCQNRIKTLERGGIFTVIAGVIYGVAALTGWKPVL